MADIPKQNGGGATANKAPATANGRPKRQPKNGKNSNPLTNVRQADGTVSDSATTGIASPRSRKPPNTRPHHATNGAPPAYDNNAARNGGPRQRPLSMGNNFQPATPPKEQAYAGPTFQASPAPSSLPVPRFFSRSVPKNGGLQAWMEDDKRAGAESSPEPDVVAPVAPRTSTQSPLDLFFNADKKEKSRNNSGNLVSPQLAARSTKPPMTEPRNPFQNPGRNIFLNEVNGDSPGMPSPQTLPVNRTRPGESSYSSPGTPQSPAQEQREAYTKSLKDLLFNSVDGSSQSQSPPATHPSSQPSPSYNTPSPAQRTASRPETPAGAVGSAEQQFLHYGSRNLSPLFQAARGNTPPRPSSGLRQEVLHDGHYYSDSSAMKIPHRQPHGPPTHGPNFPRGYPNQQYMQQPQFQHPPAFNGFPPVAPGINNGAPAQAAYGSPQRHNYQQPMPAGFQQQGSAPNAPTPTNTTTAPDTAPDSGGPADIRTMEDDLRRMLKLNVLG